MNSYSYALTFVSQDRPGIVAGVTKVLFENGFNIADSSSTLLNGIFSMILLVTHEKNLPHKDIEALFPQNLKPSVYDIDESEKTNAVVSENFVISVYGADKPGIVHHITDTLYREGINIIDLQTQVAGVPPKEAYIMILEVLVPVSAGEKWLGPVKDAATKIGTDITIRRLETFEL